MKKFDLNIEKILENWEIKHAIREIIANAIDEQFLSKTQDIQIFKDEQNQWHIRDFGRGIKYEHFTQKENDEKLNAQGIIGKFGIGLKDALATFERHNIQIKILSKFGDIVLGKTQKTGFDDLITLHAYISEPSNSIMNGTDFIMTNVTETDIVHAQNFFLKFSKETLIEATKYGEIFNKSGVQGNIYINGVLVAQEDNFLFSYNITFLNASIKKALNRERTNVGRTAYTTSVKQILLNCQTKEIAQKLVSDFKGFSKKIKTMNLLLTQNIKQIEQICKAHKVKKLYVFGSACTEKFNDNSDIDFIISFENRYFDDYVENFFSLEDELRKLLKREIDLVTEETLQNPYFIKVVNRTKTPIYE